MLIKVCLLYDLLAESWAKWVQQDVIEGPFAACVKMGSSEATASPPPFTLQPSHTLLLSMQPEEEEEWHTTLFSFCHTSPRPDGPFHSEEICFVVLICWDAFSAPSKAAFAYVKDLVGRSSESSKPIVQLLNTKKGSASWQSTPDTVAKSLYKTLLASVHVTSPPPTTAPQRRSSSRTSHRDPVAAVTSSAQAAHPESRTTPEEGQGSSLSHDPALTEAIISTAIEREGGESFFPLRASSSAALEERCRTLLQLCRRLGIGCTLCAASVVLSQELLVELGVPEAERRAFAPSPSSAPDCVEAECFLRHRHTHLDEIIEVRVSMCGNVDSGKSTLTSVLTRGCRDDGRGFARAFVFRHRHEIETGRTSSVTEHYLGFSSTGEVLNYHGVNEGSGEGSGAGQTAEELLRHYRPQELSHQSDKIVTLYDLAGHEKYLKTTVLGMTRNIPDYACVVISANNGIQRMTKEHLILCLALKLPFFVVVTRIDAAPQNVKQETMASIAKMVKSKVMQRKPFVLKSRNDVLVAAKHLRHLAIVPIIEISSVTGEGLRLLTHLLHLLPQRHRWSEARAMPKEMVIDNTYFVTGVGTVVGGVVTQGVFEVNDTVLLGPDGSGHFRNAFIKSIHVRGVNVPRVEAGNDAAFCFKKEKRSAIRKGNVLLDAGKGFPAPKAYWQFEAEVTILYHATTIAVNYEPVIHASTVLQCAKITQVEKEVLRTGDRSLVQFHFLYRPEYLRVGQRIIFREGRTKGIGVVTQLLEGGDIQALNRTASYWKQRALQPPPSSAVNTSTKKSSPLAVSAGNR